MKLITIALLFTVGCVLGGPINHSPMVIMPVMARKAGGHLKKDYQQPKSTSSESSVQQEDKFEISTEPSVQSTETSESSESNDFYYGFLFSEEEECPEHEYWHLRGKRCVPIKCPGGNHLRDSRNGMCILKSWKWGKYRRPIRIRYRRRY